MQQWHAGYVVSCSQRPDGNTVWKVKVKDINSPYNGQTLVVASVHDGMTLARGLNVHFAVGTVDDEMSQKALRSVDVRLSV